MLLFLLYILLSLYALIWSADKLVDSATGLSILYRVSPLFIGMIVVGFGTSAPEMAVSLFSAFNESPTLALGNVIGSNCANIALILGISALFIPIQVSSKILKKELPVLLLVSLILFLILKDQFLSVAEGALLAVLFVLLLSWTFYVASKKGDDEFEAELSNELEMRLENKKKLYGLLLFSFAGLVLSSRILVWSSVQVAQILGVDEVIVGLTVIAIGTSLPELATTMAAVRKNKSEMAVGNIIGSNLFNTLAVLPIIGILKPFSFGKEVVQRDLSYMLFVTALFFLFSLSYKKRFGRINRWEGAFLILSFVGYLSFLVWEAKRNVAS